VARVVGTALGRTRAVVRGGAHSGACGRQSLPPAYFPEDRRQQPTVPFRKGEPHEHTVVQAEAVVGGESDSRARSNSTGGRASGWSWHGRVVVTRAGGSRLRVVVARAGGRGTARSRRRRVVPARAGGRGTGGWSRHGWMGRGTGWSRRRRVGVASGGWRHKPVAVARVVGTAGGCTRAVYEEALILVHAADRASRRRTFRKIVASTRRLGSGKASYTSATVMRRRRWSKPALVEAGGGRTPARADLGGGQCTGGGIGRSPDQAAKQGDRSCPAHKMTAHARHSR
jgi:hypothetical protein